MPIPSGKSSTSPPTVRENGRLPRVWYNAYRISPGPASAQTPEALARFWPLGATARNRTMNPVDWEEMPVPHESTPYFIDPEAAPSLVQLEGVVTAVLSGLHDEQMMMALTTIQPGTALPEHAHPHEQVSAILGGEGRFQVGDETREVRQGDLIYIPGNVVHAVVSTGNALLRVLDVFHPIRDDFVARSQP